MAQTQTERISVSQRTHVRRLFFYTIRSLRPDILEELFDRLFHHYPDPQSSEWAETEAQYQEYLRLLHSGQATTGYSAELEVKLFCKRLFRWQKKWGLDAEWCSEIVISTINGWKMFDHDRERRQWCFQDDSITEISHIQPPLGLPLWDAVNQTESEYTAAITMRIDQALVDLKNYEPVFNSGHLSYSNAYKKSVVTAAADYCANVKRQLRKNDLDFTIFKESPELHKHIEWAVSWHVLGVSQDSIADKYLASNTANISKQAGRILDLIGLQKRQTQGRGKGVADSPTSRRQLNKKKR